MGEFIKKGDLDKFISSLSKKYVIIAPVKKDIVRFKILEKGDKLIFELPLYSHKDFFFPNKEKLLYFKNNKFEEVKKITKKRIIFLHRCDIAALSRLDKIMLRDPIDVYYKEKRGKTLIIEVPCKPIPKQCFCDYDNLHFGFDLRIIEFNNKYYFQTRTKAGEKLINNKILKSDSIDISKIKDNTKRNNYSSIFRKVIKEKNEKIWKEAAAKCLSCGACTIVCPTCNCFSLRDKLDINFNYGFRIREWSSCQLPNFTQVAGGFVFRQDRGLRVKQRVLHKFKYFKEQFDESMCTGCGRCNVACPTKIDIHKIVKKIK